MGFVIKLWVLALGICLHSFTIASPITFELPKGRRECFYALTPDLECKVSYYFAVQHGDSNDFDINYEIFEPGNSKTPIITRKNERQGEWAFIATHKGEYSFCFYEDNGNDKIVDLEINYECDLDNMGVEDIRQKKRQKRQQQRGLRDSKKTDGLQESLEDYIDTIERQLYVLERNLQYYKTRNNRNHSTVRSTDHRIALFSFYGILLVVGMSIAQVVLLQWLFKRSRKHAV